MGLAVRGYLVGMPVGGDGRVESTLITEWDGEGEWEEGGGIAAREGLGLALGGDLLGMAMEGDGRVESAAVANAGEEG